MLAAVMQGDNSHSQGSEHCRGGRRTYEVPADVQLMPGLRYQNNIEEDSHAGEPATD